MFSAVHTDVTESYRVRLNLLASKLLTGCEYVYLKKTPTHLIITPLAAAWKADKKEHATHFSWDGSAAVISLTNLVRQEGIISKDLFGKRYKVKRTKDGEIYVCLTEVVE